jgi:hypothetical protein
MYPAKKRDKIKETKRIKLGPCGFNRSSTKQNKQNRNETKTRVQLSLRERDERGKKEEIHI